MMQLSKCQLNFVKLIGFLNPQFFLHSGIEIFLDLRLSLPESLKHLMGGTEYFGLLFDNVDNVDF